MTEAQLKKLTLGELEQIADRFGAAVKAIRQGQALLNPKAIAVDASTEPDDEPGRIVLASEMPDEDAAAAHRRRQFQPVEESQPRALAAQSDPRAKLTRSERAEKERLIRARPPVDPNLPEDMQRLEQGDPP